MHLVGISILDYYDAQTRECQSLTFSSTFIQTTWCHTQGAHNPMHSLTVTYTVICIIQHSESYSMLTCLKAWRTS
jgi:hypothetical protein